MRKINMLLKVFAENEGVTGAKAIELAGCGDRCAVRSLLIRGFISIAGETSYMDAKQLSRKCKTYKISNSGLIHLKSACVSVDLASGGVNPVIVRGTTLSKVAGLYTGEKWPSRAENGKLVSLWNAK